MSLAVACLLAPGLALAAPAVIPQPGMADPGLVPVEPIPLRCRDHDGPWQDCQLLVLEVGRRWTLLLDGVRLEFSHDGHGAVTMRRQPRPEPQSPPAQGEWIPVDARWSDDPALCWDGVCAQGDIPLD